MLKNFKAKQKGAVLAVSLMILLLMTIVAISSMDGTTLGFRMSQNSIYHDEAFNNSESGRDVVSPLLIQYMYSLDWADVDIPDGVVINGDDPADSDTWVDLVASNAPTEVQAQGFTLEKDVDYWHNGADRLAGNDADSEISVIRSGSTQNKGGAGSAQYKGYHGAGVGIGGQGGSHNYFEFRSDGGGPRNASSGTAADFRYVP